MRNGSTVSPLQSIQTRVSVAVLVIFLAILWSLSLYATQMLRQDMERSLGGQQLATVEFAATSINGELEYRLRSLTTIASAIDTQVMDRAESLQILLEQRQLLLGLFNAGVIVCRPDGTAVAEVPPSMGRVGTNYMDIDTIAAALREGKSTIGQPVLGKKLQTPVFGMTVPIRAAQGQIVGALSGVTNLDPSSFLGANFRSHYSASGVYMLVSPQQRRVVTSNDAKRTMEQLPAPGVNPLLDRFLGGYEGSGITVNPSGQEVLVSAKAIPVAGWYLALAIPTEQAFAPIEHLRQRMLLATLALSLVAAALTWWMVGRQLAPMLAASKLLATVSGESLPLQPLPITRQDETGQLIGGFNRVLKALRAREDALAQSERKFSDVLENLDAYVYQKDIRGRYLFANRALCELFGRPLSEIVGQDDASFFDAQTVAILRHNDRAVFEQGKTLKVDETTVLRGSDVVSRSISIKVPLRDETGTICALWGISTDITERSRMTEELRIAAIAFECQEGMIVTDAGGLVLRTNHSFTRIMGYTNAEVVGKTTSFMRSDRHPRAFYGAAWATAQTTGFYSGEVWHRRKNGEVFPQWVTCTAVKSALGTVSHFVVTHTDISDRRQQEQQRLHNETAQRAVLVREVHHRIKNNLQGITGLLRQYAQHHPELGDTINQAIGQVQGISVVHGLQGRAPTLAVRLCELTAEIAREIQSLWQIPVVLDLPPAWMPCVVDEREAVPVALILNELILNAVKHGGQLDARVGITLRKGAQTDVVQVAITNRGSIDAFALQQGDHHRGLALVASLMPRSGCSIHRTQQGDSVETLLTLEPPVISLDQTGSA